MTNMVTSLIRTYVPLLVGIAAAWLASFGVVLDGSSEAALSAGITAVAGGLYYATVRVLETKIPWLGLLLGAAKAPVYPAVAAVKKGSRHAA